MGLTSAVKRYPRAYTFLRRGWSAWGTIVPPRRVAGIPGRVHHNDLMFEGKSESSVSAYNLVGRQAIDLLEQALSVTGRTWEDVTQVLDFGCGYGRVLRYLVERVPPEHITVCDLDAEAVRFCAAEFGAKPLVSSTNLEDIQFDSYDLIWMGSVLTHVDLQMAGATLKTLVGRSRDKAILVFTTLGPSTLGNAKEFTGVHKRTAILEELANCGFSYMPYEHYPSSGYGLAWYTPEAVERTVARVEGKQLTSVCFVERGWAGLQDFWAFQVH